MIYEVVVKPNSKKGPLVIADNNALREKPVDGEANIALIKLLSKHFGVAKSCVVIKTGSRGRKKLVEIFQ